VASGDAIAFNTLYRDRNVSWPIQDLPFSLVCFCHRNRWIVRPVSSLPRTPVRPDGGRLAQHDRHEDLLLYRDIVEALVQAVSQGESAPKDAEGLRERLGRIRLKDGRMGFDPDGLPLFDDDGNRHSGTGAHAVWLRPSVERGRVKPEATITVWSWQPGQPAGSRWRQAPGRCGRSTTGASGKEQCPCRRLSALGGGATCAAWQGRCCSGAWSLPRSESRFRPGWAASRSTTGRPSGSGFRKRESPRPCRR